MLRQVGRYIRQHHLALIALFVALGGTAYAASKIGPNDIAKNAVRSKHIKNNGVKLKDTSTQLHLKCPGSTRYHEGACIETAARTAADWDAAHDDCADEGKRLPSLSELDGFRSVSGVTLNGFEWTGDLWYEPQAPSEIGGWGLGDSGGASPASFSAERAYRCVARPLG